LSPLREAALGWALLVAVVEGEVSAPICRSEGDGLAIRRFIRYVTPVHNMCRVAKTDVEVGGTTISAGNQVMLIYRSANRDESHFEEPERFDVTRDPNNHIAFGFGTHFCLGASLARLVIKVVFEELLRRTTGWHTA